MEDIFVLPPSSTQQRLWFLDRFSRAGAAYNVFCAFALTGSFRPELFERALNAIVARHEALRTSFYASGGVVTQVVAPQASIGLDILDWTADGSTSERLTQELSLEAARPFDLAMTPLLRVRLYVRGPQDCVLLFVAHHIILDGWALRVLLEETAIAYNAFSEGREPPLPALSIQYGDFAVWERQSDEWGAYEQGLSFWRQQLAGAPSSLELPRDHPRPSEPSYRGQTLRFALSRELTDRLNEIGRAEGASLFLVVLGALTTFLHRYTGQSDILIGSPIANRLRPELEGCIGFFANTVVFRADVSGHPSFRDLVGRLRKVGSGVYAHQDVPFDHVVRAVQTDRGSQNPLFQVMLAAQRLPDTLLALRDVVVEPIPVDNGSAKFDLLVELQERSSGTDVRFEFSEDLFDRSTAERMKTHFATLLAAVVANPDTTIDRHELIDAAERDLILHGFNNTKVDYPGDALLHTMIESQVARTPSAIAVECEGRTLTFAELDRRANALAQRLRRTSMGVESFVAICLDRSVELIVGLYATLKAGGAYVPLDPDYPVERLKFMLQDADPSIVLTTKAHADRLNLATRHVIYLEADAPPSETGEDKPPELVSPDHLAYMIYTSGSTGRPKGALNTHRAICNRLAWMRDQYAVGPSSVILQKTPISFDVSVWELFLPLLTGARMVLAKPAGHRDPAYLLDTIESRGITMAHFVPSMLRAFLEQRDVERAASLKHVVCSGEALPADLRTQFLSRLTCGLENLYGPTEAAVDVTFWDCRQPLPSSAVPIGKPVANTRIYVLDANRQPTPIGVAGELYIGGVQVGRGYHERPDLTAERFVSDPFSGDQKARLYKTGDLCRFLPSGAVEFLGRLDDQVKIRGFRIELGEIESTLLAHPSVREAVVTALDDTEQGKRLVAYIIPEMGEASVDESSGALDREQLSEWEGVWNHIYAQAEAARDQTFNIIGWNDSYTRTPFSDEEMRDWVEATVARIRALAPTRVWEIGCGTGLILHRVAPGCTEYLGTDHSGTVVEALDRQVAGVLPQVRIARCAAHEPPPGLTQRFDLVILNSVAQYFPTVDYLLNVLELAVSSVRDGGTVFLGDIRNLQLLDAFHASVQTYQASDETPVKALAERVRRAVTQDQELVVHPELFAALPRRLPRIHEVEINLKRGSHLNELTRFRYDVVLRVGGGRRAGTPALEASEDIGGVAIGRWLRALDARGGTISDLPNARVQSECLLSKLLQSSDAPSTVGELRRTSANRSLRGIEPEALFAIQPELQRRIVISPSASGRPDTFDLTVPAETGSLATPSSAASRRPDASFWRLRANSPLQASFTRRLMPRIRTFLQERLPDFMVPSAFVPLERMPLSPNGKIDRRALPPPDPPSVTGATTPARDDIEKKLVKLWSDVLGVPTVGLTDNFFDLGGHSLLAAKLLTQVNKAFATKLQLPALFESGTVEHIAQLVRGADAVEPNRCVVMLSDAGDAPPIFFVHPLGGSVSEYLPLARRMAPDQPFAGLHVALDEGVPAWADTIESIATRYVDEISRLRPNGPIFVGGWSGGATVALEMAQQFRRKGREVPLVIALDASPYNTNTGTPRTSPMYLWKLLTNLPYWIQDDAMLSGTSHVWRRVQLKLNSFKEKLTGLRHHQETASAEVGGFFDLSAVSQDRRRFMQRYYMALRRYVPRRYDGEILLFKARTQPLYHLIEPELAWPIITSRLQIEVLPCTHLSIIEEPHASTIAQKLKNRIRELTALTKA
ncbi:MAG: amino acid adenylation domain-containing protein [Vicinamibacterales bacterium]